MTDRRGDPYLRGRLDAIQRGYERWVSFTLRLLSVLVLIQLGLGALSVYLVTQNQERANETSRLLHQIQQSRVSATLTTCREQNTRHDNTIAKLNQVYRQYQRSKALPPGTTRAQLKQSVQGSIQLIDALQPKLDCVARARKLVSVTPPS